MGAAAAVTTAAHIRVLLGEQPMVNIIFAAAASQNEFLEALQTQDVDWQRVRAFHMDEYIGLPADDPQRFGGYLRRRLFDRVPLAEKYYIDGQAGDREAECVRYARLLRAYPADITCLGIGENTHIAFNDPHVADFNDLRLVKVVDLDEACKQQQVHEGCFATVSDVPDIAFTLTVPALMRSRYIIGNIAGVSKAAAVYHMLHDKISERYPATILREHSHVHLFLDEPSVSLVSTDELERFL